MPCKAGTAKRGQQPNPAFGFGWLSPVCPTIETLVDRDIDGLEIRLDPRPTR